MSTVNGCDPPNTRRAVRFNSSSVVAASRRSSSDTGPSSYSSSCACCREDFRPLWREHAPAAGERLHLPTLAAAGAAAFVVLGALALAATDPKAEDVVLDMFAGV